MNRSIEMLKLPTTVKHEYGERNKVGIYLLFKTYTRFFFYKQPHFLISTGVAYFCAKFQYWSCLIQGPYRIFEKKFPEFSLRGQPNFPEF